MGCAAEVAEDVVELHAALGDQPARDGGVEAARDEGDRPSLDADRQTAVAAHLVEEEMGGARLELDVGGHLGRREVHPSGAGREEGGAEGALDHGRVEADLVAPAAAGGADGEALPPHGLAEDLDAGSHQVVQGRPGAPLDRRDRLHPEDPRHHLRRAGSGVSR